MDRELVWRIANRLGSRRLVTWSQNDQYRRGKWEKLATDRRPRVVELVEQLADQGRVVEHGCGEAHLALAVDPATYGSYVGYDISGVAIASARRRLTHSACRFEVQDIVTWPGDSGLQLIITEECLNYLRPAQLTEFLSRCRSSLSAGGAMLATFHDQSCYPEAVRECRSQFPNHEAIEDGASLYLILRL